LTIDVSAMPIVLGLANMAIVIGGFVFQSGKTNAKIAEMDTKVQLLDSKLDQVHDEQIRAQDTRNDVSELKTITMELSKGLTQLAVIQAQSASHEKEMLRMRDRQHDFDSQLRSVLSRLGDR
jgi:outer membrane murein-binding lipoprotein Lpp